MPRMNLRTYLEGERGRAGRIAAALGCSRPFVWQMAGVGAPRRDVPLTQAPKIERATGGLVTCEEMLPVVAWYRVPDPTWPHPDGRPCIDVAGPGTADEEVRHAA